MSSDANPTSAVWRKSGRKLQSQANKQLRKLTAQKFACRPDAIAAATRFSQKLKYHNLTAIQTTELCITLVSAAEAPQITYQIQATLERDTNVIATETNQAGRFVLATNVLDFNELSNDQMLSKYKEQQSAERRFG